MITFLAVLHIIFCILLICLVLLQDPKGGAAGGIFGGGSNSLMGATGGTTFLAKLTRISAVGFGVLCLMLVYALKEDSGSVLDIQPAGAVQTPVKPQDPATSGAAPGTASDPAPPAAPAAPGTPAKPVPAESAKDAAPAAPSDKPADKK